MSADKSSLLEKLKATGLDRLIPHFQAASRESIRLLTTNPSEEAVSRIGGRPNLPADIPWPSNKEGQPLSFLAQLDLAALPSISSIDLPKQGTLHFFYDNIEQPYGSNPADADSFVVILSLSNLASIPLRPFDTQLENENTFKGFALMATRVESYPPLENEMIEEFKVTEEEFGDYLDVKYLLAQTHRIGGFADQIQGDMQLDAQLASNGINCLDSVALESEEADWLTTSADNWLLLLQLDSFEPAGMCWWDGGRLFFLIHKEDLAITRFDRVWAVLQST